VQKFAVLVRNTAMCMRGAYGSQQLQIVAALFEAGAAAGQVYPHRLLAY